MTKTIIWDVETSTMDIALRTYQLKNYIKYFDPKMITRDWSMLGAAWGDLDHKKVEVISVSPQNPLDDRHVIETLHGVLSEADVLIGHNSDAFDIKKFNTRAIFYDLPPICPKIQIDTLKMARKYFKFSSNRLSYICDFLGIEAKDESPDWEKILAGDPKELRYMRRYNKKDVVCTRELYKKLRAWHHTHPNVQDPVRDIAGGVVRVCRKCGEPSVIKKGFKLLTGGRKRQQLQCSSCHGWQPGDLV